jgi:rhodanese-related sulfurtransferase
MNISKFVKTNRLFLAALVTVLIIIVVLLSLRSSPVSYKISADKVAAILADTSNEVSPFHLYGQLKMNEPGIVLVDIRNADEFLKGHIDKAVNIPVRDLLQHRSLAFFKELQKNRTIAILYGTDQLKANGPWMLLKQLGIENIKVLQGGYSFFRTLPITDSLVEANTVRWKIETPLVDIVEFNNPGQTNGRIIPSEPGKKNSEKVVPVKKNGSTGGGC